MLHVLIGQLGHLADQYGLSEECQQELIALLVSADSNTSSSTWLSDPSPMIEDTPASLPELQAPSEARYRDLGQIGLGGMGEVRRIWDSELQRTLAMKIVREDVSALPSIQRRFIEEARVVAQLQHPGILTVHELGRLRDGRLYFTMPLVEGRTLLKVMWRARQGGADAWSLRRQIDALYQVSKAVAFAHSRGVIHRDLKPDNVMIGSFGEVMVMDWGLAHGNAALSRGHLDPEDAPAAQLERATQLGQVVGTPAYMSPEQASGALLELGPPADVYALGAVLYQILSGAPPYVSEDSSQILEAVRLGPPPPLDEVAGPLPPGLQRICERAMGRDIHERYPDAGQLAEDLRGWLDGDRARAEARATVEAAQASLPEAERLTLQAKALRYEADRAMSELHPWTPVADKRPAWTLEDEARRMDAEAARLKRRYLRSLRVALDIDPGLPEAHELLAAHYRQEHVQAESTRDAEALAEAEFHLRAHDRGAHRAYLEGRGQLLLRTDPPGAEVTLYRYVERDRRLYPAFQRRLGPTPLKTELPIGSYLLQLRAPGQPEHIAYPIQIERLQRWEGFGPNGGPIPLLSPPEGAVYVPPGYFEAGEENNDRALMPGRRWVDGFAIQRLPVSNRDYLRFLNALVAAGRDDEALACAPRENAGVAGERGALIYGRTSDGLFVLQPDAEGDLWDLDWPVLMVDWSGARAYASWLASESGLPWRLPRELEWEKAARGVDGRAFPWGDWLDPTFCSMRLSHPGRPLPAKVDSFPIDESPYGVRGMAGNVKDWCLDEAPGGKRTTRGGSWLSSERNVRLATRNTSSPTFRSDGFSVRLVCPLGPRSG